jgi:hypothetical protein
MMHLLVYFLVLSVMIVSYYDTTLISLFINYCVTSDFCQYDIHDTMTNRN